MAEVNDLFEFYTEIQAARGRCICGSSEELEVSHEFPTAICGRCGRKYILKVYVDVEWASIEDDIPSDVDDTDILQSLGQIAGVLNA